MAHHFFITIRNLYFIYEYRKGIGSYIINFHFDPGKSEVKTFVMGVKMAKAK
jgi:hypothetical protein